MLLLSLLLACAAPGPDKGDPASGGTTDPSGAVADTVNVSVSGSEGAYTFAVAIRSDETGCDQYADWWEVVSPTGELIYRKVLNHSHPEEQPFTRDGGPVAIGAADEVVIRAHLHPRGYVGEGLQGSVQQGFSAIDADSSFFPELAEVAPVPAECWF